MRHPALVPRLRPFASTVFAEMTALATRTGSVNLGQGFPDTDGPPSMLAAAQQAIADGLNQYPPGPGRPELREAIAAHRSRYGTPYDPTSEVLVTAGATEAITAALLGLVDAGDEVLVLAPYYDSYAAAVAMAGATRVVVPLAQHDSDISTPARPAHSVAVVDGGSPLRPLGQAVSPPTRRPPTAPPSLGRAERSGGGRFEVDLEAIRVAITPRTRAIVVNSPHNPTGTVFTRAELTGLAQLCVEHDLIAITDEVYEHLTFADAEHVPLCTFPGMADRTVTISSAGKTFSCTGWKIGWACGNAELIAAVRAAKQFLTFVSGGPFQVAVAHALNKELEWVEQSRRGLSEKHDRLAAGLQDAGFDVLSAAGGYFICAGVRPLGFTDATELAWQLPERIGVAAVPVSSFTDGPECDHLLRFAFCKQDTVLDEAIARLRTLHAG